MHTLHAPCLWSEKGTHWDWSNRHLGATKWVLRIESDFCKTSKCLFLTKEPSLLPHILYYVLLFLSYVGGRASITVFMRRSEDKLAEVSSLLSTM